MAVGPFALVKQAQAAPYRCLRCQRNTDLVQLSGDQIPGYGIVYLCTVCTGELMDGLGMMTREQHERVLQGVAVELQRAQALYDAKVEELNVALADARLFRERISNGVRDLVDRSVSDLLAGDLRGDQPAVPVAAEATEGGSGAGDGADAGGLREADRAAAPAVHAEPGPAGGLLGRLAGIGPRTVAEDDRDAAGDGRGSDQAGDVWDFISEPDPQ